MSTEFSVFYSSSAAVGRLVPSWHQSWVTFDSGALRYYSSEKVCAVAFVVFVVMSKFCKESVTLHLIKFRLMHCGVEVFLTTVCCHSYMLEVSEK